MQNLQNMRKEFELEVWDAQGDIEDLDKLHRKLGYGKLASVLVLIGLIVMLINSLNIITIVFILVFIQLLILLSIIQIKSEKKLVDTTIKLKVNEDYLARMDGKWGEFEDVGEEFISKEHKYSADLDIFGKNSIFQYLNTTKTWHGRQKFAKDLTEANFSDEEVIERQRAVWELSPSKNFTTDFQLHGSKIHFKGELSELIEILKGSEHVRGVSPIFSYLLILPVFSSLFMLIVFIMQLSEFFIPAAILLFVHILLWIMSATKFSKELSKITGAGYRIGEYSELFNMVERRSFDCRELIKIRAKIKAGNGVVASDAINKLDRIITLIDMRRSGIMYFVLNVFFMWDFICLYLLRSWQAEYRNYVEDWFEALGDLESLLSFANLGLIEANSCLPSLTAENVVEAKELGHPLIPPTKRVNNDAVINNEILIISGSNMSGKTTFLRTIGVNMVLGLAGGFVCAKELNMPNIGISTSMRIADDLSEGVSTFYAELQRIKGIIDECKGKKTLFLIDEMFRGTNSKDRLEGAQTVIKSLESEGSIGLVTTHDLALCDLAKANERVVNYSFSEEYVDDEIVFDYKLRVGKSDSTNARFLMGKLGIEVEE